MPYKYDRGEHRHKHCWNHDKAGFVVWAGHHEVGKCPKSINNEVAEAILNQGVAEPDPFPASGLGPESYPQRLYGVYRGVIYEAVPTQPGSYHGYPWQARNGRSQLPVEIVDRLREMAVRQGCVETFERWLDEYG